MALASGQTEALVLEAVLPALEADGFAVYLQPGREMLPPFMQGYRPDAIALRADKKIALEVKAGARVAEPHLRRLQELFSTHPDWELRIIFAPPRSPGNRIATVSHEVILKSLSQIPSIFDVSGPVAGLVTAWSAFEAAARAVAPDAIGVAQEPRHLLEKLATEGYLTPDEADRLRPLAAIRNEAAHGSLTAVVPRSQLEALVRVASELLQRAAAPSS